jgi:hypothetical protein
MNRSQSRSCRKAQTSRSRGRFESANAAEPFEVSIEADNDRLVFDCQRGQVRIVDEVAAGADLAEQRAQDRCVAHRR